MTEAKMRKLITHWINVLCLTDWEFELFFDSETEDEINGQAQVAVHTIHKKAKLTFPSDQWRTWPQAHANKIVVHELVHVLLSPLVNVGRDVAELKLNKTTLELYEVTRNRVEEQITDQLEGILTLD